MILNPTIIIAISFGAIFSIALYKIIKLSVSEKYLYNELQELKNNHSIIETEKINLIKQNQQLQSKLEYQANYINDFEKMRKESQESTKAALFSLGNDLSKQLIEIHKKENKEARELSEQNIKTTSEKFNNEFTKIINLVSSLSRDIEQSKDTVDLIKNSLLSPSGAGRLAEITLENILKSSGLRSRMDFLLQHTVAGETNTKLRPDAVIFLPADNIMVVDAKASKFLVDNEENQGDLLKTMNLHLKSLASKEYAENIVADVNKKGNNFANIITLMFLPTEHAIEKVMELDPNFIHRAWEVNIFPVGPTGLMNMLSFAKFQISERLMLENHQKIINEVKRLIGSISSLAKHSSKLGKNIENIVANYDKFAASFNHNFLSKVKNVEKLGVGSGEKVKQLPLERYQVVTSKSELIEVEESEIEETENNKIKIES